MITQQDKWKIREFLKGTNWSTPDWSNEEKLKELCDILKAFNDDPQLAIQYWKEADQKSSDALRHYYLNAAQEMGFSIDKPISKKVVLNHFQGDQEAVNQFFTRLKTEAENISKQIFKANFTDVVMQILTKRHTVQ
ncbi:MAG: hypothetical protein AAFO07_29030 [Bacteroidota bacterium]